MALTLNTQISDAYANSYVDTDYADDYWTNHFSATKSAQWLALTDDQKTYTLIQACRIIETVRCSVLVPLNGNYTLIYDQHTHVVLDINIDQLPVKFYYFQSLQFPRNLDRDSVTGVTFIPEAVKMAQCEQALFLLNYDDSNQASRMQGVEDDMARVGSIHVRKKYVSDGSAVAPMALEFLRPLTMKTSTSLRRA